ncbi:MAG: TolB family protein, partial [Frankiaceae bacterium]
MRIRRRLSVVSVTAAVVLTTVGSAAAAGGTTSRVSVSSTGAQANPVQDLTDIAQVELDVPTAPAVSADGRYVVFTSDAANLVPGDTNDTPDVFVRDRRAGTTTRVSVSNTGAQGNGYSYNAPAVSADGRYVAFVSDAANLVPGDTNGASDVFVRDRRAGTTTR